MKRNNPEFDDLLHGEEGLWAAVLLNILNEIEDPLARVSYDQARRIIVDPESGCLPFIAAALGLETGELQKMVIRRLKRRGTM